MRWINLYGEIHAKDNITDIEHELRDGSNKLFVVGKEGQPSLKHESLYLTVQAVCTILCFHGDSLWTHYLSIDVELCSQFLSVLSLFRPLRFARPSFSVAFHRLLSRTAAAANTAGVSLPDEHIIVPAASFGGYRSQDLGGYVGDMDMHGGMGSAVETIWGVVSKAPHDFICPFDPCLLDGVASLVNCGYQIYFDEQGSELSQKFNNLTAFAPLVSRTHADSEGDRSSATSLMWPGTTQNEEGKPFEEGSSYESSLLPSLDMYRGDDSHSNAIPPRHPVTNSGEEWTPAPLSRQRRRNRRKIGDSSEEHDFSGTSVYQSVVPQSFVMTRGDDVGLTFKSQSSVLGEKTPFSHLLQPTINVKNKGDNAFGAVPTFDRFAVPAAIFRESSGQTAMGISTGTKHSPALNDFQKRAREYSVGSVGSW